MPKPLTPCGRCEASLPDCWRNYAATNRKCCPGCGHANVPETTPAPCRACHVDLRTCVQRQSRAGGECCCDACDHSVQPTDPDCYWCGGPARICAAWLLLRSRRCCDGCEHRLP